MPLYLIWTFNTLQPATFFSYSAPAPYFTVLVSCTQTSGCCFSLLHELIGLSLLLTSRRCPAPGTLTLNTSRHPPLLQIRHLTRTRSIVESRLVGRTIEISSRPVDFGSTLFATSKNSTNSAQKASLLTISALQSRGICVHAKRLTKTRSVRMQGW